MNWRTLLGIGFFAYLSDGSRGLRNLLTGFVFVYAFGGLAGVLFISFAATKNGWLGWSELCGGALFGLVALAAKVAEKRVREKINATLAKLQVIWPEYDRLSGRQGAFNAIRGRIFGVDKDGRKWIEIAGQKEVIGYIGDDITHSGYEKKPYSRNMPVDVIYNGIDDNGYVLLRDADGVCEEYIVRPK